MSDHEELESSVAAWVLGALDAHEAASVRVHVEGCASCRQVAGRLRRVVGALPLAVEEVAPPARGPKQRNRLRLRCGDKRRWPHGRRSWPGPADAGRSLRSLRWP